MRPSPQASPPSRGRAAWLWSVLGAAPFRSTSSRYLPGAQLATSLNGGSVALKEVLDMAALGRIKTLVDRYPLSAVKQAYDDFKHGHLVGRAVVIPDGLEAHVA